MVLLCRAVFHYKRIQEESIALALVTNLMKDLKKQKQKRHFSDPALYMFEGKNLTSLSPTYSASPIRSSCRPDRLCKRLLLPRSLRRNSGPRAAAAPKMGFHTAGDQKKMPAG